MPIIEPISRTRHNHGMIVRMIRLQKRPPLISLLLLLLCRINKSHMMTQSHHHDKSPPPYYHPTPPTTHVTWSRSKHLPRMYRHPASRLID
eukprot:scaffold243751_cov24-Attheya_sp.AAC.1